MYMWTRYYLLQTRGREKNMFFPIAQGGHERLAHMGPAHKGAAHKGPTHEGPTHEGPAHKWLSAISITCI